MVLFAVTRPKAYDPILPNITGHHIFKIYWKIPMNRYSSVMVSQETGLSLTHRN
jgi:hypothetical protein